MTSKPTENVEAAPLVSIGLPVYNGAEFLEAALDSLLSQTCEDFEIIISDNGSTDATESICRRYAARDPRIRYHREETNRGACWNFNRVFELARCRYFKFAAHDDLSSPTFLARCVEVLERDPTVVCCHTRTAKIDLTGEILASLPDPTDGDSSLLRRRSPTGDFVNVYDGTSRHPHRRFRDVLLNSGWSAKSFGLFRSDVLRQTGMLQPVFGYEKVFMGELALLGRFHVIPETLFYQRVHPRAASSLASAAQRHEWMAAEYSRRLRMPRLRLLVGHLRAAMRMPISSYQRLRCLLWVAVYLLQISKWKRVGGTILRGTGIGGANGELLKRLENSDRATGREKPPLRTPVGQG